MLSDFRVAIWWLFNSVVSYMVLSIVFAVFMFESGLYEIVFSLRIKRRFLPGAGIWQGLTFVFISAYAFILFWSIPDGGCL